MVRPSFQRALLLSALALGGCRGAGDPEAGTPIPSPTPSEEPSPSPAPASSIRARLTSFSGDVRVKKANGMDYEGAVKGMALALGDLVTTGASGHATLTFRDGSNAVLTPQSLVTIEPPATSAADGIAVQKGRVDLEIDSRRAAEFRVKTPDAEAAIR